jgi:beta-glucosidase
MRRRPRVEQSTSRQAIAGALGAVALLGALGGCTDARPTDDLVGGMRQDEKLAMVVGTGFPFSPTGYAGHLPGVPRLGIPDIYLADGASGVGNGASGVTAFACGLNNAASFDPDLVTKLGQAQGGEHAGKGHQITLAPTLNIARTPLNGRTFEGYGEDPYLVGVMATAYVKGVQAMGVVATPKHYAANNQETNRGAIDVTADERTLREIYYPGFEAALTHGRAGAVMCSYNKLNGLHACENPTLLSSVLGGWGYGGFVVSDWWGTHSTAASANAGLDLEMPGDTIVPGYLETHFNGGLLANAIARGEVAPSRLDDMVRRILSSLFAVGVFKTSYGSADRVVSTAEHRALARAAAAAGTVLLKNEPTVLPLGSDLSAIAVIGDDAGEHVQFGGFGSAAVIPSRPPVSPFDAIAARAPRTVNVTYAQGTLGIDGAPPILATAFNGAVQMQLYTSDDLSGNADGAQAASIDADALPVHDPPYRSARAHGTLVAPSTGTYRFSLSGRGEATLQIEGALLAKLNAATEPVVDAFVDLVEGTAVSVEVDYIANPAAAFAPAGIHLGWQPQQNALIARAASAAAKSDVAIVFASTWSSENMDHSTLALPADQDQLIAAVAAANPRTIVVLHTGGPVLMPWLANVAAVLEGWYPGEEGGMAISDILFGDVNPSGRLPITFPVNDLQTPLTSRVQYPGVPGANGPEQQYTEGLLVGYRWFDAQSEVPLFPFGHGLSYTAFAYGALTVSPLEGDGADATVSVRLTNRGSRAGAEVPQLYVGFPAGLGEPPRQLRGLRKVFLEPGQSAEVTFQLDTRSFSYWDENAPGWTVAPGRYALAVGSSSRDLRSEGSYTVR